MHPILQQHLEAVARAFIAEIVPWLGVLMLLLLVLMLVSAGAMVILRLRRSTVATPGGSSDVATGSAVGRGGTFNGGPAPIPAAKRTPTARMPVIEVRSPDAFMLRLNREEPFQRRRWQA